MALELRQAPRVAVDLLRRRRRHALGLLLLSRGPAAREAAREGLLSPERRPWDQASRGADEEARDRHLFHFHGVAFKNLAVSGLVCCTIEPPLDFVAAYGANYARGPPVRSPLAEFMSRNSQNSRLPRWMR